MSNDNVRRASDASESFFVEEEEESVELGEDNYDQGEPDNDLLAFDDNFLDAGEDDEEEYEKHSYRYSGGNEEEGGYDQEEEGVENDGNASGPKSNDMRSGAGFSSFDRGTRSSNGDSYWNDDWPFPDDDNPDFGEDEDLELGELEGDDDDTIMYKSRTSGGTDRKSADKTSKDKLSEPKEKKKRSAPIQLGKRSFRWFEQKLLAQQIQSSEENLRRKRLLEKCQMVRKVSKPVVTLLATKSSIKSTGSGKIPGVLESNQSVVEGDGGKRGEGEEQDQGDEEETDPSRTFRDYTEREWAVKNTVDFLTTQGCTSSSSRSYTKSLRAAREELPDFRLALYEHQLQKRRKAIGSAQGAPEITAALRRHAERAVWRAVMDSSKPRYPIPRFILPRHRYLKKVQAQFLGPGSYETDVFESQLKARRMKLPSTWATCTSRFPKDPAESGKAGGSAGAAMLRDPWTTLDEANRRLKHPGTCIPFESTPKNFRKGLGEGGSRVPPNAYNIKSPMEEYIKKQTSIRGPYDCYTPSRGVIPYGYYKSTNDEEQGRLGPGSYEIRTSLVKEMNDSYSFFKGAFGKAERNKMFGFKAAFENPLWPRENGSTPAVGQYDPYTEFIGQDKEQNMAPFKVQAGLKQREIKKPDLVAADYYFYGAGTTWTEAPKGAALASVFRSKTPQIMPPKMHHIIKERNKPSNKKLDLDGLAMGYHLEEHYAENPPDKHTYVLEDCKDPCLLPRGPRVNPYAIPAGGGGGGEGGGGKRGGCCGGC